MTEINTTITKDEADRARAQWKEYRAAQKAEHAAYRARWLERIDEMRIHGEAEEKFEGEIAVLRSDTLEHLGALAEVKGQIDALRETATALEACVESKRQAIAVAIANRNAARAAIKTLRAEIRGEKE
jgi:chromosome segregation ATPase